MNKRPITYRKKSVKQLFEVYAFELDRINQEDKNITQSYIANELCERVNSALRQLDDGCTVESVFKQFMEG